MLSRALSLATVMLLFGFATVPVQAQNLEAGKSPSQIFSGSCAVCHKSPRGLLKTIAPGALPGFLRQHYTTSSDQAGALSAYLISNGASDKGFNGGGLTKQGAESRSEPKPAPEAGEPTRGRRRPAGQEAARPDAAAPDADGLSPQEERAARRAKRMARPAAESPDAAGKPVEREPGAEAESAHGKRGKKGRRIREEAVKPGADKDESSKSEAPKQESKPSEGKPSESKSSESKPAEEAPKSEAPATRADPVPAVTPAPKSSDSGAAPASPPAASTDQSAPKP